MAHLTEEEQEATINSIVEETVTGCLQSTPIATWENNHSTNPLSTKKCALEKLLDDTFSANPDSSISLSFYKFVLTERSQYKSEPVLELKEKTPHSIYNALFIHISDKLQM